MEKIVYLLWRDPQSDAGTFAGQLRSVLAPQLLDLGVAGLKLNLVDAAVAPAAAVRQTCFAQPLDALVQVWVDSAIAKRHAPVDACISAASMRSAAWLVTESQPLVNRLHPPQPGQRTEGFAQVAVLRRPARLSCAEWLDIWHNGHTDIAIETQSTFEYIQNVVVRPLTANAPAIDAIVEECFPAAAMTDPQVFFDARGDEAKLHANLQRMMDSVNRFIDPGTIDVAATSQYRYLA